MMVSKNPRGQKPKGELPRKKNPRGFFENPRGDFFPIVASFPAIFIVI